MQALRIIVPGSYWDSQIYQGRLYLFNMDGSLFALDWDETIEEYPQSGERIRGKTNLRAIIDNYPGRRENDFRIGTAEITGNGDDFVARGSITYPNGETWHAVMLITVRDGKIAKITSYFAAPFEAPAWRAKWVERVEAGEPAPVGR